MTNLIDIERDSKLVNSLALKGQKLTGSAYVQEVIDKHVGNKKYTNVCLKDIQFEYCGKTFRIDHCWLQQRDYPKSEKELLKYNEGLLHYFKFTFYQYRDEIDKNKCGMTVRYIELY